MSKNLIFLLSFLILLIASCSSNSSQIEDVQPLSENIPTQVATLEAPTEPEDSAADSQPTSASVISFTQIGGARELCNELAIAADGSYTLSRPCDQFEISGTLENSDFNSLQAWFNNLATFQLLIENSSDNPDSPQTNLKFSGNGDIEADDSQQQVIFDWVNGLIIRLDPQDIAVPPTPELSTLDPAGLCPDIARPALITANFEMPDILTLIDPENQTPCEINLSRLPVGRIATASGAIFYPVFNPETETVTVLRLDSNGEQNLLPFTELPAAEQSPTDFVVSNDGTKIAWVQTIINTDVEPPLYTNNLWLANIDGSNQVTILDNMQNEETRFVTPIRFSTDSSQLFYALQPDVPGLAVSGRFDNLYSVTTVGDQSELVYNCPAEEQSGFCISGFSFDGTILTIIQPADDTIQVLNTNGTFINSIPLPATDYVERVSFSPGGTLAFVSATLTQSNEDEPPYPDPGYLTILSPPYTDQAQTLLSDNSVGTLWGWLDESRLVYGLFDEARDTKTAILTLEGESTIVSSDVAVGVLR